MNTRAADIGKFLLERGEFVATAESCTGGLIAKLLTDIDGSSGWFERGVITYSNLAKRELLDVPEDIIDTEGAVSEATALSMVEGLLMSSPADWGIAVTGIAGPTGGTASKPVGTVWIAWLHRGSDSQARRYQFDGSREQVRSQTADAAMEELLKLLEHA
jgi:nicotinamide-nucleotide amidase